MPLTLEEKRADGSVLCVWKITETEAELKKRFEDLNLSTDTGEAVERYKVAQKRMQWYAAMLLSNQCIKDFQGIYYDQFGAPHLTESDICVSYSHSNDRVAMIHHPHHEVGVDIQKRNVKLKRIADKFLNEEEHDRITKNGTNLDELHVLWSVKEAIFKIHKHHLPFKDIRTDSFKLKERGKISAQAHRFDGPHVHELDYRTQDDFFLVTTCYNEG